MNLAHTCTRKPAQRMARVAALGLGAATLGGCGEALIALATWDAAKLNSQTQLAIENSRAERERQVAQARQDIRALEPSLSAYYVDPARDGDPSTVSSDDLVAPRTSLVFRDDEYIGFAGDLGENHRFGGQLSIVHVYDAKGDEVVGRGSKDVRSKGLIMEPDARGHFFGYGPGDLSPGQYRAVWSIGGSLIKSLTFDVRGKE